MGQRVTELKDARVTVAAGSDVNHTKKQEQVTLSNEKIERERQGSQGHGVAGQVEGAIHVENETEKDAI